MKIIGHFNKSDTDEVVKEYSNNPEYFDVTLGDDGDIYLWDIDEYEDVEED